MPCKEIAYFQGPWKAVPTMGPGMLQPLVFKVSLDKVLESGFRTTYLPWILKSLQKKNLRCSVYLNNFFGF